MSFKLEVVEEAINHGRATETPSLLNQIIVERRFLELIPPSGNKLNAQKCCLVPTKQRKTKHSPYQCKNCATHPGLCTVPCFEVSTQSKTFLKKKHRKFIK